MKRILFLATCLFTISPTAVFCQTIQLKNDNAANTRATPEIANLSETTRPGPNGGSLKQSGSYKIETIVTQGGFRMFVYDSKGKPVTVDRGRGTVSVKVEGNAKRYRYDLLPDGKGALTAPVNLSRIAGRQIDADVQLVGITPGKISFAEVATVPASQQQLAAAAIARQKICPVSGKPLGSMGDPVAVDIEGRTLYVCCAGCVNAVKSNPAKYATGRPEITVTTTTQADAAGIASQKVCPVMDEPLGSMGTPIKVSVGGKPIYLCCKGCIKRVKAEPAKYLAMVHPTTDKESKSAEAKGTAERVVPAGTSEVRKGVFKVTAADKAFIAAQKKCPVMEEPLDSMGGPYKVNADGKAVYICCPGCAKMIAAEPKKWLAVLQSQGVNAPTISRIR